MSDKPTHYDADAGPSRGTWIILLGVVAVLAIGGVIAIAMSGSSADESPALADIEPAVVSGRALAIFTDSANDEAVGKEIPFVEGVDFDGNAQVLEPTGQPMGIVFLAHWCPHCQKEVPILTDYLPDNTPADVELYSIATATDSSLPNYPPVAWLDREGWPVVTMADSESNTAGQAASSAIRFASFATWALPPRTPLPAPATLVVIIPRHRETAAMSTTTALPSG